MCACEPLSIGQNFKLRHYRPEGGAAGARRISPTPEMPEIAEARALMERWA